MDSFCPLIRDVGFGLSRAVVEEESEAEGDVGIASGVIGALLILVSKVLASMEGLKRRDRRCAGLRSSSRELLVEDSGLLRLVFVVLLLCTTELLLLLLSLLLQLVVLLPLLLSLLLQL